MFDISHKKTTAAIFVFVFICFRSGNAYAETVKVFF